jgi:hypothetical protein
VAGNGRRRGQLGRRPGVAMAAAPALPAADRVAGGRPAQQRGQEVRLPHRRRHVPGPVRRRRAVGARRHARPGAGRRRSRRRVRPGRDRVRGPHAHRAGRSAERRRGRAAA